MDKLSKIEGIGKKNVDLLNAVGIEDQMQLLNVCSHQDGRRNLAELTGISDQLILKWTNQADLARIIGINDEISELLRLSGIHSVPELAQINAKTYYLKLKEINERIRLVSQVPSLAQLNSWVMQAKNLPLVVRH